MVDVIDSIKSKMPTLMNNSELRSTVSKLDDEELSQKINILINEVIGNREVNGVEFLGEGSSSLCFEIKLSEDSFVVKLGKKRTHLPLPEHRRILKPMIRREITDKDENFIIMFEIQDKVKSFSEFDIGHADVITGKEVYELMMELISDGIVYTDTEAPITNIGRDKNGLPIIFDTDCLFTKEELGKEWDDVCHQAIYGPGVERQPGTHYYIKSDKSFNH